MFAIYSKILRARAQMHASHLVISLVHLKRAQTLAPPYTTKPNPIKACRRLIGPPGVRLVQLWLAHLALPGSACARALAPPDPLDRRQRSAPAHPRANGAAVGARRPHKEPVIASGGRPLAITGVWRPNRLAIGAEPGARQLKTFCAPHSAF